ncbi:MAG TPA: serine hydrolase domain-containing protein [Thermomicrobiaceae bacterium]|nr:serine hydrolase domain-containing protein [Thermomicrobiaceae bacterium]
MIDQDGLRALVEQELRAAGAPGAAVAVWRDGAPLWQAGVGTRDLEGRLPLAADAPFYIYSVTKPLLATQVLRLAGEGRVELDAPLGAYLPEIPLADGVSVRRLLNHTAGLPDYGRLPAYVAALRADPAHPWSDAEFLARTLPLPRPGAPGEAFAYSNLGYLLLRLLLERQSGQSLRRLLQEHVFAPLGLTRTFVAESLADAAGLTPGFGGALDPAGPLMDIAPRYHPGWVAHGLVVSTAPELARLGEALFTGRLLGREALAAMLAPLPVPVRHPLFVQPAYGLGLMLDPGSPHGLVAGHGGGGPGYSAGLLHVPNIDGRRVTAAALVNRDVDDLGLRLAWLLAQAAAG